MFYGLVERTCYECKRVFVPAPYHAYKDNKKIFCRYSCYMAYFKRKERKKVEKKIKRGATNENKT